MAVASDKQDYVYIMKSDHTLQKIGTITSSNNMVNVNKIGISSVDNFNSQLLDYIKYDNSYSTNVFHVIESEDIFGIVFYILRWRRCTGYLVIQKSNRGVRYLCYLYSKIKHSAQSFGTSCENVDYSVIKEAFIKHKTDYMKMLRKCEAMYKIKNGINNINSNIDKLFGI